MTIAALYVETDGCYFGIDGVDPWDEARDARLYAGPWPVVAHPPCQRWGKLWAGRGLDGGHLILKDAAGKDRAEWPPGSALHTFEFPAALN